MRLALVDTFAAGRRCGCCGQCCIVRRYRWHREDSVDQPEYFCAYCALMLLAPELRDRVYIEWVGACHAKSIALAQRWLDEDANAKQYEGDCNQGEGDD